MNSISHFSSSKNIYESLLLLLETNKLLYKFHALNLNMNQFSYVVLWWDTQGKSLQKLFCNYFLRKSQEMSINIGNLYNYFFGLQLPFMTSAISNYFSGFTPWKHYLYFSYLFKQWIVQIAKKIHAIIKFQAEVYFSLICSIFWLKASTSDWMPSAERSQSFANEANFDHMTATANSLNAHKSFTWKY